MIPILSFKVDVLSEVLQWIRARNSINDTAMNRGEEEELLEVIVRNSKRLQQLTDDILDVTKIESRSLFFLAFSATISQHNQS
jgi:signal transduction histidine kinase